MFARTISYLIISHALVSCNSGTGNQVGLTLNSSENIYFESPEHLLVGGEIYLKYPNKRVEKSNQSKVVTINLTNGDTLPLSFAEVLYLAGDFMGDPNVQISGHNAEGNETAFLKNFEAMFKPPAKDYLPAIIDLVKEQTYANASNVLNGKELYIADDFNRKFNCATGGGCYTFNWLLDQGLYLKLANVNYDHFGEDAINSYLAGHRLALKSARQAKITNSPDLLRQAYAYEAYAQHFLTDLASSGHLRTPRKGIAKWCSYTPDTISLFLANIMHKEDNYHGIHVTDFNGESWVSYGDAEMFINENNNSLHNLMLRMQKSVNQVYDVYTGQLQLSEAYKEAHLWLPNLEATRNNELNSPMLFKMEGGKLLEYDKNKNSYTEVSDCIASAYKYYEMKSTGNSINYVVK